jgi:UDP-N-acetyl-D-glucosamine/UDP-N-acetyl-D-galactosamine dehydrogenase
MVDKIAIIGLGYVGLPLAVAFAKLFPVVGFDTNQKRVCDLSFGDDTTLEVGKEDLASANNLLFSTNVEDLNDCNIYVVTVPTPVTKLKQPDLRPIELASEMIGKVISEGDIIIYECTVYPGVTEEICVPILEAQSRLKFNVNFFCGYSPERINPGDKTHRLSDIVKITSGSTPEVANKVDSLYGSIISAGTHKVASIKIAEAAKVIENTQRDVNIALINELALIFNKLDIDTESVLKAAGTKWNFVPFRPGLVGGHCIGVDPYYLTYKAIEAGYNPEMILAGRALNDSMPVFVKNQVIKLMKKKNIPLAGSHVLIMGLSFKENCPDIRNSKVVDLVEEFSRLKCSVDVYDPWVDKVQCKNELDISPISFPEKGKYSVIILAVAHEQFKTLSASEIRSFGQELNLIYDLKYLLKYEESDGRL